MPNEEIYCLDKYEGLKKWCFGLTLNKALGAQVKGQEIVDVREI